MTWKARLRTSRLPTLPTIAAEPPPKRRSEIMQTYRQRIMASDITRIDIAATHERIAPYVRRTPVITVAAKDFGLGAAPITFKIELTQHAGNFKTRGAFANLLMRRLPAVGVVAASGGNHGAAVAYAAMKLDVPAKIFVPKVSSSAKVAQIRSYGAELVVEGDRYADALALSEQWRAQSGAMPVHAFDQRATLLGQGTVAREFEAQAPDVETWLVAVGGGGLIGGMAAWSAGTTKVVGVEPTAAPTLFEARRAGRPVDAPAGGIAADSLAPKRVGELMFPIAQRYVADVVLVSDDAIREAQRTLWRVLRLVTEPGGAVAFAALLSGAYRPAPGEQVGVLLCGGNTVAVDFDC
jgi:threonine dehydratase